MSCVQPINQNDESVTKTQACSDNYAWQKGRYDKMEENNKNTKNKG